MAVDGFIWFDKPGVGDRPEGESLDKFFGKDSANKAFEIKDFSFGVENPTTVGSATGGAGAGKIKFNEFTIKRTTDKSSPTFFKNCCIGTHYGEVNIAIRKAGGDKDSVGKPFIEFKFGTVFTTKIDWSGPGDEGPEESVTFVFGQFGVRYTVQQSSGDVGEQKWEGWDQVQNINNKDIWG